MSEPSKCECYYCTAHRIIHNAYRDNDVEALFNTAKELGNRAISAEFDNDYYKAILDGDWPSSVEILQLARKKADRKRRCKKG